MRRSPWLLATCGLLILSGCLNLGGGEAEISPAWFEAVAPRQANLAEGAVRVVGPSGYCIDPLSLSDERPNAVALAACTALANSVYAGPSVTPALIVVSTSGPAASVGSLDVDAQIAALSSSDGRAALSATGQPQNVTVTSAGAADGGFLVQLSDSALPASKGLAADHARVIADVNGHVVSIAAYGANGSRWGSAQSARLVRQTLASIRAANGGTGAVSEIAPNG